MRFCFQYSVLHARQRAFQRARTVSRRRSACPGRMVRPFACRPVSTPYAPSASSPRHVMPSMRMANVPSGWRSRIGGTLVAVRDGLDGDADCSVSGDDARVVVLRAARGVRLLMGVGVHACVLSVVSSDRGHYATFRAGRTACRPVATRARPAGRICDLSKVTSDNPANANTCVSRFGVSRATGR